jgi:hypothetical protein
MLGNPIAVYRRTSSADAEEVSVQRGTPMAKRGRMSEIFHVCGRDNKFRHRPEPEASNPSARFQPVHAR